MKNTAYLDNNIIVETEQENLSTDNLRNNIDKNMTEFYYSSAHLQEANEIKAETSILLEERLQRRFETLSLVTNNKYVNQELPSNKV
ncbi:hypothetical protein ADIWIN_1421 [Winogradskyella psychrotolerans RS-3]|uniref:Uncharacterized protein n=1 Tax=Winogradskyella psychrotolerans RS-3 TaxID=641526 RepID=S7VTJ4_9FLAO|nr:hypothetical protein [Winogradskyella psychrotolerans]EPR73391.1 hypothetical protein ADIWIN_1421 [Winogradskyella psychrotolerans RS-3]